jgi:[acyl-carrier-protein] S-malonyltransferase
MIKKAFLFPGQGSQYIGMGKNLCEKYEAARKTFEEADEALGFKLSKLCFSGDIAELTLTKNAQPAILTTSVAMFRVLQEKGITPEYMAGHSLGEISALTCAGAISFVDAVRLANKRGMFMQDAVAEGKGAMAAVNTRDIQMLKEVCEESAEGEIVGISNYNSFVQQVISGDAGAVNRVVSKLEEKDIKVKLLNVSAPFHSPLMQPAADRFVEELKNCKFQKPMCQVIANVDAKPYANENEIADKLIRQIVSPVRWTDTMTYLKKAMVRYCVEVGAGHVLKNLMKTNVSDLKTFTFDTEAEEVYNYFENSFYPFMSRMMGIIVATKNNNWNEEEYKNGVIKPYSEISDMQKLIEAENRKASVDEMKKALDLLIKVFETKKTPAEEQKARISELIADTNTMEVFKNFDYSVIKE